jgi:hypothetical protein
MVTFDQVVPRPIAAISCQFGRTDNVSEQNRREHAIQVELLLADARDESTKGSLGLRSTKVHGYCAGRSRHFRTRLTGRHNLDVK